MTLNPTIKKAYWALAAAGAAYFLILSLFGSVWLQRQALYAHKFNTAYIQDINKAEQYGYLKNQVNPFIIKTSDGESLYAWHIIPTGLYADHAAWIVREPQSSREDITQSLAFQLLQSNPESCLVINFHGNLGHVGQGWRTDTYRALFAGAPDKIHVLSFDYRGFGHSTGTPSEEGLILDGIAAVNWALKVAGIPSSRILLIGHSLGTAITTAVAEYFVLREGLEFAGVVLVAAFTDIPALMLTYNAGGIVPVLSPLKPYPRIQQFFARRIVDRWMTVERLERFVKGSRRLHLTLLNAKSDHSIAWQHSQALFYTAVKAIAAKNVSIEAINEMVAMEDLGEGGTSYQWTEGPMEVRWELMRYGGHDRLMTYAPVTLAVRRAFGV